MLVLSRKIDEVIMIGEDIAIIVVEVRGNKVRLGIDAPKGIPVHRKEVYDTIKKEGKRDDASQEKAVKHRDASRTR